MSRYSKFLVAIVGAIATWASTYYPDDPNVSKWVGLALALATCVSVYAVPNTPPAGQPSDPNMSEQGAIDTAVVIAVAVVVIAVIALAWALGADIPLHQ